MEIKKEIFGIRNSQKKEEKFNKNLKLIKLSTSKNTFLAVKKLQLQNLIQV